MTADRWVRVKEIFQDVVQRQAADRPGLLDVACGPDIDLRRAVERLLSAHDDAGAFLESPYQHMYEPPAADDAEPEPRPDRIGPYRILGELGRGGMGTVYLAERDDPDLRKTVALKVVDVGSRSIVRRFRLEMQILSVLEHPGVARLYDGGTTDSGVPYFVMEYVAGKDVLSYCDERSASIAERLQLFAAVCDAVQYAHQNFVVHRDLKPSNIMVTDDGHPKLLDFGIAKLVSADADTSEETVWFGPVLTPQYSSPEHLRGEPITTASDVYSLGVVLYELVSGCRPYQIKSRVHAEIERSIHEHDVVPPSRAAMDAATAAARGTGLEKLRRELRGNLDNIVLKALSREPEQRYATAADLAAELRRHLGGFPVLARPDSSAYRMARFVRRHRVGVTAIGVTTMSLVAGLALATWEAHLARIERDRARQRFDDVRRTANSLIFTIHDSVQNLPGSTAVRRTIIAEALNYLERLRTDAAADDSLRIELAQAYHRIATVQGQGNVANLGDRDAARESFAKAIELLRPLVSNPRAHPDAALLFGRTQLALATAHQTAGRKAEAARAVEDAASVSDALVQAGVGGDEARRLAAGIAFERALLVPPREALAPWKRAGELFEALLAERPQDPDRQRNVALVEKYLGASYDEMGDYQAALAHHRRALDFDQKRLEAAPDNRGALSDLAIDFSNVAHAHWVAGRRAEAAEGYERSLVARKQLAESDPNDVFARGRVAFVHSRLADIYGETGQDAASLAHAREAFAIADAQKGLDPVHSLRFGEALLVLGEAEARVGEAAAACRAYRRSAGVLRELHPESLTTGEVEDLTRRAARDLAGCAKAS